MLQFEKDFDVLQKSFTKEELAFAEELERLHCSEQCNCQEHFCVFGAWELKLISTDDFINEVKTEFKFQRRLDDHKED